MTATTAERAGLQPLRLICAVAFMALLAFLSLIPGSGTVDDSNFIWVVEWTPKLLQKSLHVLMYGVLASLWAWTLDPVLPRGSRWVIAISVVVVFGAAMEWLQLGVPGRFGTLLDILLNLAGAILAVLVAFAATGLRRICN